MLIILVSIGGKRNFTFAYGRFQNPCGIETKMTNFEGYWDYEVHMYKKINALVLREIKYKEADKILTVLSDTEGKMTVGARGAMKKGSLNAPACQLFAYSELNLYDSVGKWYIRDSQTIEQFLGLRDSLENLALASYFAELLEAVSDEDMVTPQLLSLGLNSLYALSRNLADRALIKAVFELRLMCLSGYEPNLLYCCEMGEEHLDKLAFNLQEGSVFCKVCERHDFKNGLALGISTYEAMSHILYAPSKKIFSFKINEQAQKELGRICERYVEEQLERSFSSLSYYKSICI